MVPSALREAAGGTTVSAPSLEIEVIMRNYRKLSTLACALIFAGGMAGADPVVIDGDAAFPEGPYVMDGKLYYVEYAGNTLDVWDGSAKSTLWQQDGCGPSAVLPFDGDFLITCYDSGTLVRVSQTGETQKVFATDANGDAMVGPNDLTSDGMGGVFVTASGPWESAPIAGKVYALSPGGQPVPVADDLHYANGIALAPTGDRLFVIESEAGRVISFAIGADHSLSDRRLFVRLAVIDPESGIAAYPDGMEFAPDGNLWIGQYSSGRIVSVTPEGTVARVVVVPSTTAPNLAF
ncbi:MAG: SMP-30/gluconolactonase/LRE family protein, partial [Albidovulum sp.]